MGCAPSNLVQTRNQRSSENQQELSQWLNGLVNSDEPENLLLAYLEIEKNIMKEESQSPASILGLSISRQQQIKIFTQAVIEKKEKSGRLVPQENSIQEIFADLGLHRGSVGVAAEHEEFIANINRKALDLNLIEILKRRSAEVEENIHSASLGVASLHMLYEKQDLLLGRIYGDTYGSEKEMVLEEEIDTMRNYRDAFSSGALLWNDSARTVQDSSQLLSRGVSAWKSVQFQRSVEEKISMATEARNAIQEAAVLIEISHDSMPAVQFPYCTKRELTSICQAIEYIFTDILIEDRYRHALEVYKNFHERAIALTAWIKQIYDSTLKKDLEEIDNNIWKISRYLRSERIKIICEKLDIDTNHYDKFSSNGIRSFISENMENIPELKMMKKEQVRPAYKQDGEFHGKIESVQDLRKIIRHSDLHAEFEKNLIARRNAMWPSRTIEELHMMPSNISNYS